VRAVEHPIEECDFHEFLPARRQDLIGGIGAHQGPASEGQQKEDFYRQNLAAVVLPERSP